MTGLLHIQVSFRLSSENSICFKNLNNVLQWHLILGKNCPSIGPLDCFPDGCIQVCVYQNLENFQWSVLLNRKHLQQIRAWTLDVGDIVTLLTYSFFKTPFGSIIFFARVNSEFVRSLVRSVVLWRQLLTTCQKNVSKI